MKTTSVLIVLAAVALGLSYANGPLAGQGGSTPAEEAALKESQQEKDLLSEHKVVESKREKREFRIKWWASRLKGDMRRIYEAYGYPSTRYREEVMGRVVETWTYIQEGRRFTFRDGNLAGERRFTPGTFRGYRPGVFIR